MSNGIRQAAFNIEEKLATLRMTPSQRTQARDAVRAGEDFVEVMEVLVGLFKRLAVAMSLKPSVRT